VGEVCCRPAAGMPVKPLPSDETVAAWLGKFPWSKFTGEYNEKGLPLFVCDVCIEAGKPGEYSKGGSAISCAGDLKSHAECKRHQDAALLPERQKELAKSTGGWWLKQT
jgi:hypothetical protein